MVGRTTQSDTRFETKERFRSVITFTLFPPQPKEKELSMPMSFAKPADLETIGVLRSCGALVPFEEEHFHHSQAIAICSDGFRVHIEEEFVKLWRRHGVPRPIMFGYRDHGIAMRFGIGNPISPKDHCWCDKLGQFEQAQRFAHNEIQQFNLVHHWPCGAALETSLSLVESLLLVLKSKARLKRCAPFKEISMLLWVDAGERSHIIHRIKKVPFLAYLQALPDQTLWQSWLEHEALLNLEAPDQRQAA